MFNLSDKVQWSSKAGGFEKVKCGVIVCVIAPGRPVPATFRARGEFGLLPRSEVSYIVEVPGSTKNAKPKFYWPFTSKLSSAQQPK